MKLFGYHVPFTQVTNLVEKTPVEAITTTGGIFDTKTIPYQLTLSRQKQDLATWRAALIHAENIKFPNRTELYRLYKDVVDDAHIFGAMTARKNQMLSSEFMVVDNNDIENEEKTALIKAEWFIEFVSLAMDSIFYGYSAIQFVDNIDNQFREVYAIPREYIKQELGLVVPNPAQMTGKSYLEDPMIKDWIIGVGGKRDLGLLAKLAPLYIWKKNAETAWADYTEIYGIPMRLGKTNLRDQETRELFISMMRDMGKGGYAVVGKDDIVEIIEASNGSSYQVFDMLIDRMNSEISKLILGQTSTMDEKAHVGSANVHERVLHEFAEVDERFICSVFTKHLIPFLNQHGFGFEGFHIKVKEDDELDLEVKSKIDLALLEYYDIPVEYIMETYGTPVIPKAIPVSEPPIIKKTKKKAKDIKNSIQNDLDNLYGIE
jgi:hypothetical protein